MKYIKGLLVLAIAFTMTACTSNETTKKESIKVLAPMGATALSVLGLYGEDNVTIDTVDGSDILSAELAKENGYDAIIAPINLGAKLISTGKSDYVLETVVTWGNLYIIGSDEAALSSEGMFAAFGEQAVPQKVLMSSLDLENFVPSITYFNSPNEVQAQLLTQQATVGMLAEPAATATIAKAKEKGMELKVLKDLQKEYQEKNKTEESGYPQAALFVKKGSEKQVAPYLKIATEFANETSLSDEKAIVSAVEKATIEKLGIPNVEIAQKTWKRQNIKFVKANEAKKEIKVFLQQFDIILRDKDYTK